MGDPLVASRAGNLRKFVYSSTNGNAFITVITQRGRVSGLRLWALPAANARTADPFGITLNEDVSALLRARGKPSRAAADADGPFDAYQNGDVLWLYHVNGNSTVRTITLSTTQSAIDDLQRAPLPELHTGASPPQAIRMDVASANDAKRWESMFFAVHPCGSNGSWRVQKRRTLTRTSGAYDAVTVTCSTGGQDRTLYFTPIGSGAIPGALPTR